MTAPSGIRSLNQRTRPYAASCTCILRIQRASEFISMQECSVSFAERTELYMYTQGSFCRLFVPKLTKQGGPTYTGTYLRLLPSPNPSTLGKTEKVGTRCSVSARVSTLRYIHIMSDTRHPTWRLLTPAGSLGVSFGAIPANACDKSCRSSRRHGRERIFLNRGSNDFLCWHLQSVTCVLNSKVVSFHSSLSFLSHEMVTMTGLVGSNFWASFSLVNRPLLNE